MKASSNGASRIQSRSIRTGGFQKLPLISNYNKA